jgi:hypothetical protein
MHGLFGLGIDHEQHPVLIGERTAQDHEAVGDEGVHERRVFGEAGLIAQRQCRVPGWTVTVLGYQEDRHLGTVRPSLVDRPDRLRPTDTNRGTSARFRATNGMGERLTWRPVRTAETIRIMTMSLPAGEPAAGPWRAASVSELVEIVVTATNKPSGRPQIVAVDGHSASGKSSLAARLHQHVARSAVVHTDDVAWNESFFGWSPLLAKNVLEPLRRGESVTFRPPAWARHGRDGAIGLPAGLALVLIEGVGAGQREHSGLIDATIWVQSDVVEAEQRGIARDIAHGTNGNAEQTITFWHTWMAEELPFLAADRPWERACVVVAGSPTIPLGPDQLALAPVPG